MSEIVEDKTPRKKGGMMKIMVMFVALLALVGGGVGAGLYASSTGLLGGGHRDAEAAGPRLVPKSEQKRAGGNEGEGHASVGHAAPAGSGGGQHASHYYAMDKEFTSNLRDSVHFIQVGIAVSSPYDDSVIENLKTNEIAVRSSILMALGDTTEEQGVSSDGKKQLERRLVKAINDTLKEKEGFGGVGNVYFTNFVVQ